MFEFLREAAKEALPEATELRREFHRHPELAFAEQWTSARISRFLQEAGIPFQGGYAGGTGLVACIEGRGAPCVALRADMDALAIAEETGLPYASEHPGQMHACGHDGHMACLCGVARMLWHCREQLPGTVRLLFQPGEENAGGGRRMVDEGALEGVDAAFALHAWPGIPAAHLALAPGTVMASADFFQIRIRGRGGHGAEPGGAVDPIVAASHTAAALHTVVSREVNPWQAAVLSIGKLAAGNAPNIIPDEALLEGTLRALDEPVRAHLREAVARVARHTAAAFRAEATVEFQEPGYPPLRNDGALAEFSARTLRALFGEAAVQDFPHPVMTSEDFAFYTQAVPGVFLFLGNDGRAETARPRLHTATFDFNEAALATGMLALSGLAWRFLETR